jgi:hypothetical protein
MPANRPLALVAVLALVVVAPASSLAAPSTTGSTATSTSAPVASAGSVGVSAADAVAAADAGTAAASNGSGTSASAASNGSGLPAASNALTALRFETAGYAVQTVVETEANTTNYLEIPNRDVERDGYANASADVVGAIERDLAAIRSNYTTRSFAHAYDGATESETVGGIRTEVERLETRIETLRERQERAIKRYNDQAWTTERFLRELSTVDAVARGIDDRFDHLENAVILPLPSNLKTRMQALQMELVSLRGPVRSSVGEAISGERAPFGVYTATTDNGVVTAYTDGQLFYREAFLGSNRARSGANLFVSDDDPRGFSAADQRAKELYPWAYAYGGGGVDTFVNTTIYEVTLDNPHGTLDVYLDGRTTDAFREIQRKGLSLLPTDPRGNISNGVSLQINRTHGTGPLEVVVTEDTGEPLNATVTVNGYDVGRTGADGRLWTVTPYQQVRIVAETADGRTVTLEFYAG